MSNPVLTPVKNTTETSKRNEAIFVVGRTGAGKSTQFLTLPGKKFAYLWDPNALATVGKNKGIDYLEFMPESSELDLRLKGFNKESLTDRKGSVMEPVLYTKWQADFNNRLEAKFFQNYDWVGIDSATFFVQAMMERQMYLNRRTGEPPDMGDYRVVGDTLRRVFVTLASCGVNVYMTGHLQEYQDEKTKKITVQSLLPGNSRVTVPLACSNVWLLENNEVAGKYTMRTRPDPRGMRDLRSSLPVQEIEDVTVKDISHATSYGIGAILEKNGFKPSAAAPTPAPVDAAIKTAGATA